MEASSFSPTPATVRAEFEELIKDIRPQLHRYAARMIGSVVDGEDVVQEALTKAYNSLPSLTSIAFCKRIDPPPCHSERSEESQWACHE